MPLTVDNTRANKPSSAGPANAHTIVTNAAVINVTKTQPGTSPFWSLSRLSSLSDGTNSEGLDTGAEGNNRRNIDMADQSFCLVGFLTRRGNRQLMPNCSISIPG